MRVVARYCRFPNWAPAFAGVVMGGRSVKPVMPGLFRHLRFQIFSGVKGEEPWTPERARGDGA